LVLVPEQAKLAFPIVFSLLAGVLSGRAALYGVEGLEQRNAADAKHSGQR